MGCEDMAVDEEQVASHEVGVHPKVGVESPSPCVGTLELLTSFAIETDNGSSDVVDCAVFGAADSIAISKECNGIALNADDAVKNIEPLSYLGQHGVADFWLAGFGKQRFVAIVFEEWSHTNPPKAQGDGVAFVEQSDNFR